MILYVAFIIATIATCVIDCAVTLRDVQVDDSNATSPIAHLAVNHWIPTPAVGFFIEETASAEDFLNYANKGGALMCALTGSDKTAGALLHDTRSPPSAASLWRGDFQKELQAWYWHKVILAAYSCSLDDFWDFPQAMKQMGLNGKPTNEGGDIACFRVEHWDPKKEENGRRIAAINQWYEVNRKSFRATQAHFEFGIDVKGGAIYNFFLEGPKHAARSHWYGGHRDASPEELPQLRALSDILWGFWSHGNTNVKNIRYFFMVGVMNDVTNAIIASCLRNARKQLSEWPGTAFTTDSDEGHSLLGSPNGAAFAYFLMQHKAELGHKMISKVTVFKPENDDNLDFVEASLVFHVQDAPEPPPDEEDMRNGGLHDRSLVREHHL